MAKFTWSPNNQWAFVQPESAAIAFDLERGLLVLITATAAGGEAFGSIGSDDLVPASWAGGSRRFGAVPSTEVVTVGSGARRWGAVPSDESVPADSDWTT